MSTYKLAIMGGFGPMGLGTIDYALHCDAPPGLIVVADTRKPLLRRAQEIFAGELGKEGGARLVFLDGSEPHIKEALLEYAADGYDDVFSMVPAAPVVELAGGILLPQAGRDRCAAQHALAPGSGTCPARPTRGLGGMVSA